MKWIDTPPVWLLGAIALTWMQANWLTLGLDFGGSGWTDFAAGLLIGGGIVVILVAARAFQRHRTTIHPHETPSHLLTTGIYRRSRNPIYLADLMILAGFILLWEAVLSLALIPVLAWILEKRFIEPEENRLRRIFRADFARYERKTRRWL